MAYGVKYLYMYVALLIIGSKIFTHAVYIDNLYPITKICYLHVQPLEQKSCSVFLLHTVFSSSTCSSDFRSPNCCRKAMWEGKVVGSRKLSKLNNSSTLFCSGVPVRSTLCSRSRLFRPSRSLQFLFLSR